MDPLVTAQDFTNRQLDPPSPAAVAAASAAVRDAAGAPISAVTATVTLPGTRERWLPIPGPATAVTAVAIDGEAVTDHRVWPNALWRECGWGASHLPVTVALTFGLAVPDDIKQLVCELAIMASTADAIDPRLESETIDDYQVRYTAGTVSSIELPERTRELLRARFSGSAVVTGSR